MTFTLQDPSLLRAQAYIDGQWQDADSGSHFAVYNPASMSTIAQLADLGATETTRAITAAETALVDWRERSERNTASTCVAGTS